MGVPWREGSTIRIAAARIDDGAGRTLLVRKHGTAWFMHAGGKIEPGEDAKSALRRELREELGLMVDDDALVPLGRFAAPAAHEPGCTVDAEVFVMVTRERPAPAAEIAEAVWIDPRDPGERPLAPLTRDHVLPRAGR